MTSYLIHDQLRIEYTDPEERVDVVLDAPPSNRLSFRLLDALDEACDWLAASDCRVAVVRSSQPAFMAGADLQMIQASWSSVAGVVSRCQELFGRWERLQMPTVAAINGDAIGGGCELALACDFRLMATDARFGFVEVTRGLLPAGGGIQQLLKLVTRPVALDLCMRGRRIDAFDAKTMGIVTEAVEPDDFDAVVDKFASELASLPRLATRAVKACIVGAQDHDPEVFASTTNLFRVLHESADGQEGIGSVVDGRPPTYPGTQRPSAIKELRSNANISGYAEHTRAT